MGFLQKHPEIYTIGYYWITRKISSLGLFQESAISIMKKTPHLKPRERL
ncbi:hypothetical protein BH11CYA1_BH11CYA1_50450 [soil metagenome]